ncbi:MAG: hypothetical protein ACJA1C_000458 [Crocinitomicaceae bacterium]|jgi:hypothetical protein
MIDMETKYFLSIYLFLLYSFLSFSQPTDVFVCGDVLIYKDVTVYKGDTLENIRVSRLSIHEETLYTEQTLSLSFYNDSLGGTDYERNVNYGRQISNHITDSCKQFNTVSVDEINDIIEGLINKLLDDCQQSVLFSPLQSKKHFDLLNKLILILDNENLSFLNEYCMYHNLDLVSLETHFADAKFQKDEMKMLLISQAYRINKFEEITHVNFNNIWFELMTELGSDNLFSKCQLRKIGKVVDKKSKPYELKGACWLGHL